MMLRRSPAVRLAFLLSIAACGKEQPGEEDTCLKGPMEVEVGTGQSSFVPMPPGGDLPFYAGPQGGYHVYGSVRARGYTPGVSNDPNGSDHPTVRYRLLLGAQTVASTGTLHWNLAPTGDGWRARAGAFVVMSVPVPLDLEGEAVSLEVEVIDRCQLVGTDTGGGVLQFAGSGPAPG